MTRSVERLCAALVVAASVALGSGCELATVDLVVEVLSGPSPQILMPGDGFALENRVCNQGVSPADATGVTFLIREAGQPPTQQPIGARPLPPLGPGECDTDATPLSVPYGLPDGAFEIVAVVDDAHAVAESDDWNNFDKSAEFGVGWGPDLVVEALALPPVVGGGTWATVGARVCNPGSSWSGASRVAVLLSTDDEISTDPPLPDFWLGEIDVPPLEAGACADVENELSFSAPDGVYTAGALADSGGMVVELLESNNSAPHGQVGIGWGPDLVVSQIDGPPSAVMWGSFDVDVTVCNQGTAPSPPGVNATLHFSADGAVEPGFPDPASGDPTIGGFAVPWLAPGGCHTETVNADASAPSEGAWRLGAFADPDETLVEVIEDNNGHAGGWIGVGSGPDYAIAALSAPPSASDGFQVDVRVCNRGTMPGPGVLLAVYLSADLALDAPGPPGPQPGDDPEIGAAWSPGLAPDECADVAVDAYANAPDGDGAYWLAARVDPFDDVAELIEFDNDFWGGEIGIGWGPDLIVASVAGPPSALDWAPFQATAIVCNQGTSPSGATNVAFLHSADAVIEAGPPVPGDFYAGEAPVPALAPGQCASVDADLFASVPEDGPWYLGAAVDFGELEDELIETNNTRASGPMGVGAGPDLRIEWIAAPPSALPGAPLPIDYRVCNVGTTMSGPTSLALYLSEDDQIDGAPAGPPGGADGWLADAPLPALYEGECHEDSAAPPPALPGAALGAFWVGGIVDEADSVPELNEANNALAGDVVGIGSGPDYVVGSVSAPPAAFPAGPLTITVEVCNEGTQAGSPAVSLYLSADGAIESSYYAPGGDPLLGVFGLPSIAAGACWTEAFDTWPGEPPGAYRVGAIADDGDYESELREDNNAGVGNAVGLGNGPDLVVASLDAPPSVAVGVEFVADVEICNQGNAPAPVAWVSLYHTEDETITGQLAGPIGPDELLGFASTTASLDPAACETLPMAVTSWVEPGTWRVGAIVDEDESLAELLEDNNERVSEPHDVAPPGP